MKTIRHLYSIYSTLYCYTIPFCLLLFSILYNYIYNIIFYYNRSSSHVVQPAYHTPSPPHVTPYAYLLLYKNTQLHPTPFPEMFLPPPHYGALFFRCFYLLRYRQLGGLTQKGLVMKL